MITRFRVVRPLGQQQPVKRQVFAMKKIQLNGSVSIAFEGDMTIEDVQPLPNPDPIPETPKLLNWSDFTYEGSFVPETIGIGGAELNYGGGGLGFNAKNNSLFVRGRDSFLDVLEVEIPSELMNGFEVANASDLPKARLIQGRRLQTLEFPNYTLESGVKLGSFLPFENRVYGQIYEYYDGNYNAVNNVFYFDSDDLANANINGLFQIGFLKNASYVSGYFGDIPTNLQTLLGGYTHFGGNNGLAVTGRCSQGPVFVGFNPNDIGVVQPTDAGWYLYYEDNHRLAWDNDPVWNAISRAWGALIPDESECVVFIGRNAVAGEKGFVEVGYGLGSTFNDSCNSSQSYHSINGDYGAYYWMYNIHDLVKSKNGEIQPYEIQPYAHGEFSLPFSTCQNFPNGCAYDRTRKRFYTCEPNAYKIGSYTFLPIFHCWSHV